MAETTRLFHLPFSFMLPQRVASERGYFAEEGLDVELVERDREEVDWKYIPAEETLTGDHEVDLYPVCKWESLKRTWDMGDGRIVAKGTFADQPYAVFTRPGTGVERAADLAGEPVGVNMRTGQEYTARRALEEHVAPSEVRLEHAGMPTDRLEALRDGEVTAVTLLEPHSTLAEHLGFQRVLEYENHMGVVGADHIDGDDVDAFMRAYQRAVDEINANPEAYRDRYLEMLEEELAVAPELFAGVDLEELREGIEVPEYETPDPAETADLGDQLEWMKNRELIDDDADIGAIVARLG